MKLESIPLCHVEPGDVVVGHYVPDAPTTPVQPMAVGLTVESVETWGEDGTKHASIHWAGLGPSGTRASSTRPSECWSSGDALR